MEEKSFVTYEDFGAVGDGINDDMEAICTAHDYANEKGLPVKAKDGAVYYIGGKNLTAEVKTSTNFGKAKFIIDDRKLENIRAYCFKIASEYNEFEPPIKSIKKGQKTVDFPHEGNVYVRAFSEDKKIFIRKGLNQNNGTEINDCFVVNEKGEVTVDIDRDIDNITKIKARRIDDEKIVICGGTFVTIANQWVSEYKYHSRGFIITRSGTLVEGITHLIEGEGETGAPYGGFFTVHEATDVTIKDCLMTPHKTYYTASRKDSSLPVGMGTYELSFAASINTKIIGIRQTRAITDRAYWGLMGSNFCKNIIVENCIISRFDAHMGVTGAVIKNSEFGHQCLNLIGYGDFYIENSTVNGHSFINMRQDYGSFWDGRIIIKNCKWRPMNPDKLVMINGGNTSDHDFGYECRMPYEISIDGMEILDSNVKEEVKLYILPNYDKNYEPTKPFMYVPTKKLIIKGVRSEMGRVWELTECDKLYPGIIVEKR